MKRTYYQRKYPSEVSINLPGHAWIEYYVPGFGWVTCDPTWGAGGGDYFNKIDFTHLLWNVGENFGGGIDPNYPGNSNEVAILPAVWGVNGNAMYYDLTITVTVLEAHLVFNNNLWMFIAVILIIGAVGLVSYILIKAKNSKKEDYVGNF